MNAHIIINNHNKSKTPEDFQEHLMNWLSLSADNIVILILLIALALKFIFIEDETEIGNQLKFEEQEESTETQSPDDNTNEIMNPLDVSIRRKYASNFPNIHTPVFPLSDMVNNYIEIGNELQIEFQDQEVQTDAKNFNIYENTENVIVEETKKPRSVDECLSIYQSQVSK